MSATQAIYRRRFLQSTLGGAALLTGGELLLADDKKEPRLKKAVKFGIVASSFPLKSVLNFDLSLFVGSMASDCSAGAGPGCYPISVPGLFDATALKFDLAA